MPVLLGLGYLVGLYGLVNLASYAGEKSRERRSVEGHKLPPGAETCWSDECDPYIVMPHPNGTPGLMKCIRPQDPDWCIALGYQLELARCRRCAPGEVSPGRVLMEFGESGLAAMISQMRAEAALAQLGISPVSGLYS